MNRLSTNIIKRHPLVFYFLIAYAVTWLIETPLVLQALGWADFGLPSVWHYLGALGPFVAAFVVSALEGGQHEVALLVARLTRWRVGFGWFMVALLSPALFFGVAAVVHRALNGTWPDLTLLGSASDFPGVGLLGFWTISVLTYGLGEETGWRGFALPRMQKGRNALYATLMLTLFWAAWHIPFFFYRPSMPSDAVGIIGFFVGLLAGAIWFTFLYNSTRGSVLMTILWHGAFNAFVASDVSKGDIAATISMLVMLLAVVALVVGRPTKLSFNGNQGDTEVESEVEPSFKATPADLPSLSS